MPAIPLLEPRPRWVPYAYGAKVAETVEAVPGLTMSASTVPAIPLLEPRLRWVPYAYGAKVAETVEAVPGFTMSASTSSKIAAPRDLATLAKLTLRCRQRRSP